MEPSRSDREALSAAVHWLAPLGMTFAVQCVSSFLLRLAPTIAPILIEERGVSPSTIGYLSAISTVGAMLFLIGGGPLMDRTGSVRALQIGLGLGAVGAVLVIWPAETALMASMVLIGLGYGPSTSAGSDILQRYAPPRHRSLIFSIKQAGVPAGGILAGLLLPPAIAWHGLEGSILLSAGLTVLTVLVVQPTRRRIDPDAGPLSSLRVAEFFAPATLSKPIRSLLAAPGLTRIALCGLCLAVSQGVWVAFLVTILVSKVGLTLTEAGGLFAVMQVAGLVGRVALGWASDRLGSGRPILQGVAVASAALSLVLITVSPDWPFWALAALCVVSGLTVTGWNGVQMAEVTRQTAPGQVRDSAAGATLVIFIGFVLGPAVGAVLVELTDGFAVPLAVVAVVTLAALPFARRPRPQGAA